MFSYFLSTFLLAVRLSVTSHLPNLRHVLFTLLQYIRRREIYEEDIHTEKTYIWRGHTHGEDIYIEGTQREHTHGEDIVKAGQLVNY